MAQIKLAEYTFDNSVGDCLPTLRLSSIEMTTEDIVSGAVTRRTVYIDDATLPYQLYFQNQTALLTVDYLHIGSNITNLASLFSGCTKLKTVNTTNWDLSSCTNISFMFQNCSSLTKLDLRNWVTGSITTMQGMFHSCTSLTEIKGIENFNVTSSTSFGAMFYKCSSLTKLDLRNWVTSSATSFQDMFASCHNLEVIRVDNFDTSKVTGTGLNSMFSDCTKVKTLNLNSFVNAGLGNFLNFCYKCESLEYISTQNFIWGKHNSSQGLFTNCKSLKYLDFTTFDGSTIGTTTVGLRLGNSLDGVTCPIYYNSNTCTVNDTGLTNHSKAVDVKGRLMAIYDFNNTVTTSDSAYPVLTGSTVTKTIDTQGSESNITHRVIGVDVMPTAISFQSVTGLLNVDYLAVTSSCISLRDLFNGCIRLSSVNTFGWDTQNVTTLYACFQDCGLTNIDLQYFNTSKVTDMSYLFKGSAIQQLDMSSFDTSSCTSFNRLCSGCTSLTTVKFGNWNTTKVKSMTRMFESCTSLIGEIDMTSFDTKAVTDGSFIYINISNKENVVVYVHDTNWTISDTSLVYDVTFIRRLSTLLAKYTFDNSIGDCLPTITGITTSDYKVSDIVNDTVTTRFLSTDSDKVITKISFGSLGKTSSLLTLDYLKIDKNITQMNNMFQVCSNVTSINAENWDTSNVTNMAYMLQNCHKLTEVRGLGTWDTSKVTAMDAMFQTKVGNIKEIENWDVSSCKNFSYMFVNGGINSELNLSNWQPNNLENCQNMFANSPFTSINLSGWNVPKLSNMSSMFAGAGVNSKLQSVNMSNWTMGTPANMNSMFYNNSNLTSIDFTGSKMVSGSLSQAFQSCSKLTSLDVSGFDTSQCTNMGLTFSLSSKLTTLTGIENWVTDKVTAMNDMFNGLTQITELNLANWDTRKVVSDNTNMFRSWTSDQTVYYEPPFWSIGTTTLNSNINWVVKITRNNGYWLDMTGITGATEITLYNENNLPTEEILTDWGDGTQNSELTHTYSTAGNYIVVSNLQNGNANNNMKGYLTKATIYYCTTPASLFFTCSKLKEVNLTDNWVEKTIAKYGENISLSQVFYGCTNLETANTIQLTKFKPTHMVGTFYNCKKIKEVDLTGLDTSSVKGFNHCFATCESISEVKGIENWDTSSATDMSSMFAFSFIPTLNLSSWDFSKVTTMYQFAKNSRITSIDLSNATFNNTRFTEFLYSNLYITTVNLSGANISGDMESMFLSCSKLENINLTNAIIKPSSLKQTFCYCGKLTSLDTERIDVSSCKSMESTFKQCSSLTSLDLSSWNTSSCTNMASMFRDTTSLLNVDVLSFNIDKVISMDFMFSNCAVKQLDISSFKITDSTTFLAQMFVDSVNLESVDLSNLTRITTLSTYLFRKNTSLKTIGMLYSSAESINNLLSVGFHNNTLRNGITVYYYDADPSQLTPIEGVTFKKYAKSTTIQLPPHIQLNSLPDGTCDELDVKTGILTRNIGVYTLTASSVIDASQISAWNNYTTDYIGVYIYSNVLSGLGQHGSNVISNRFGKGKGYPIQSAGVSFSTGENPYLAIAFHRNMLNIGINDKNNTSFVVNKFYEWLKNNHITLMYDLPTPTTEQLILNYNNSCNYGRILPTGMCDKYDVVNSMYTQTMTSILLDGENTWDAMEEMTNVIKFTATGTTVGVENLNMLGAGGLYCDNDLFPNINDDSDVPHCRVDEAGNKFYIYVDKEMLMSPDLIGWQIWLQANNFNLIYELAEHLTYVKPYEELDPTQARWEGMDCMRDGAIKYHANNSDNLTIYPTLEYVAPSINNFEVPMLEPNTDYTIYAEGINTNDIINLGGTDINFNNGTVVTSGDNQWLRIDNNDSFYNMVITKGDTTGEVVPYFEGMTSVENPVVDTTKEIPTIHITEIDDYVTTQNYRKDNKDVIIKTRLSSLTDCTIMQTGNTHAFKITYNATDKTIRVYNFNFNEGEVSKLINNVDLTNERYMNIYLRQQYVTIFIDGVNVFDNINMGYETTNFPSDYIYYYNSIKELMIFENVESINIESNIGTSKVSYTDLKLRSLPNGVKDTINVVTGEYIQRVGEVVLNGSEDWVLSAHDNSTSFYTPLNDLVHKEDYLNSISCDKFVTHTYEWTLHNSISLNGISAYVDWLNDYPNENWLYIKHANSESSVEKFKQWLKENPVTVQYELAEPITTKLDPQTLLAYTDGTINLSSDTGLLPTTHYTVPSTNTFHLPSMKTGTRYTLKYPSASGSITIGDITYKISSASMLFTTPLKINGDTSAIIFSDANPENVILLEGAYNKREVPFFTGVKSVKNPNITIIDQLSTESTTYNCETEIELRGLPNGVADKLDIIKGKLTTNVGIRPYQEGDENLPNIWTDGYETVYALSSPVVTNVTIDRPTVTTNSLIDLSSDYLIPQLNYRAPSSNNFPLDLLQPNTTYTLYADTLTSGSYTLGGTRTGVYSQPHTIILGDMTDNLLTFNGDLGLSNVMLVKGNSLKTTLPPYFLGIRSVTDGHLLVEGMAGEMNELTIDEGIVLRDCNGVKDFIDLMTCTLTKRTGEITLTGAEGWYRADNESTTDHNVFKLTLGGLKEALVMCDTLQSVFDTKMMDCIHAHTNELCIVIANATIGGNTVNALKSWLNQHPTTVVYQLRTPIEVQLENTWTTLPPTSYDNQTEISSTVSTNSLKPMISVTIATTTLEEIVSNLEAQNAQLEEENTATMLALTSVYELMSTPSVATTEPQVATYGLRRSAEPIGMSVSPMGMVYARLVSKGFKTIEEVPYNLQPEVMYALRGME